MAHPKPVDIDRDDTEVEINLAVLDADVSAALDFLCAHAGEWAAEPADAARITRHRRRIQAADAPRRAG